MNEIPYTWGDDIPRWLRALGCFEYGRKSWRFRWGEVSWNWGLALNLSLFDENFSAHIHLGYGGWFIKLPFLQQWHREPLEMMESWGFTFFERAVHLHWGSRAKVVYLPWDYGSCIRHEVLRPDGTWAAYKPEWRLAEGDEGDGRAIETHPFRYVRRSGEVQERTATIYVSEMEWRWRWLRWSPWPRKVSRDIDVTFSEEVGERSGSWKGGVLGTGYKMLPGETAAETLRRMERDWRA